MTAITYLKHEAYRKKKFTEQETGTMGIDYHALQFLRFAAKHKGFGVTATIGRQGLYLREQRLRQLLGAAAPSIQDKYCESILSEFFGATIVESYDNSDYEGASHIADMNMPFTSCDRRYDTIVDAGTLEHIYNVPQALANISEMCRAGGQILHILPANNHCGHGFWQFSPELFFSLYSEGNGYTSTEVFLAELTKDDAWYEVKRPVNGHRAEAISPAPLLILCRTIRGPAVSHASVQQSDYVHLWDQSRAGEANSGALGMPRLGGLKAVLNRSTIGYRLLHLVDLYRMYARRRGQAVLSGKNPHLVRRPIMSLV